MFAEFLGAAPDKGRPVFASFAPTTAGVGIPGDVKAAITVGPVSGGLNGGAPASNCSSSRTWLPTVRSTLGEGPRLRRRGGLRGRRACRAGRLRRAAGGRHRGHGSPSRRTGECTRRLAQGGAGEEVIRRRGVLGAGRAPLRGLRVAVLTVRKAKSPDLFSRAATEGWPYEVGSHGGRPPWRPGYSDPAIFPS